MNNSWTSRSPNFDVSTKSANSRVVLSACGHVKDVDHVAKNMRLSDALWLTDSWGVGVIYARRSQPTREIRTSCS